MNSRIDLSRAARSAACASVLAALVLLGTAASAQGEAPRDDGGRRPELRERVIEILIGAHPPGGAPRATRLARLGPDALPLLFEMLDEERLPTGVLGEPGAPLGPEAVASVRGAFEAAPAASVLTFLAARVEREDAARTLATAMELIGAVGEVGDLPLAYRIADRGIEGEHLPLELRVAFEECLATHLEREPDAAIVLASRAVDERVALLAVTARAIGRHPSPESLQVLGDLLGRGAEVDMLLLTDIERIAQAAAWNAPEHTIETVRRYLGHERVDLSAQACRSVAALGDCRAAPELVGLLSRGEPHLRDEARRALELLTAQSLGDQAQAWEVWLEGEQQWWRAEAPSLLVELRIGTPVRRAAALEELARGRLFRAELIDPIEACLDATQPGLSRLACVVLGTLESKRALPRLSTLRDHEDPNLARAARAAITRIVQGRGTRRAPRTTSLPALRG